VKLAVAALSLVFIAYVALADYLTKYQTAVSLLYIVPIVASAWASWEFVVILIAGLSGISDSAVTCLYTRTDTPINILNSAIQTVFFVIFAACLIALKRSQGRLKMLSRTDPLTELLNSRYFFETGNLEIQRAFRYKHPFSIVYMDIDNFKVVNDTLGHSAGNVLLRDIAKNVKSAIRKTDTMARLGGDEFALLLPETSGDAAKAAVDRIQASLSGIKMSNNMPVTFSIGVVTDIAHPSTFDELIKAADALMYEAKRAGKNTARYALMDS